MVGGSFLNSLIFIIGIAGGRAQLGLSWGETCVSAAPFRSLKSLVH